MESPRKALWRSASWSTKSPSKLRPSSNLPSLYIPDKAQILPPSAAADGDLSAVTDALFLSGATAAADRDLLLRRGITHIINCAAFSCRTHFPEDFTYLSLYLRDHPSEDISSLLYDVFDFIEKARASINGGILLHCSRGTSRSASFLVGYLMWRQDLSFLDALEFVRAVRAEVDPNPGFVAQLLQWRSSQRRVYHMAPHSALKGFHLVPKVGTLGLDSRGAFVVEGDEGRVFLWVGEKCENLMEERGGLVGEQLVRYGRVKGPLEVVREGCEGEDFWVALGRRENFCEGERRVEGYDLDFEIYKRGVECEESLDVSSVEAQSLSPLLWPPFRVSSVEDGDDVEEVFEDSLSSLKIV